MAIDLCRIGRLLRETREKKGLTFDEVSDALCIRKRAIGAIEAGDWDNLPHPVYVKGYVTHYATFLNIPGVIESEVASGENGLADHLVGRGRESAADKARTVKTNKAWRSIFTTSTFKFYELCQKCFLL